MSNAVTTYDDSQIEIDITTDEWAFVNLSRNYYDGSVVIHVDDGVSADERSDAEVVVDAKTARAIERWLKQTRKCI
jgi:hypothetical protein